MTDQGSRIDHLVYATPDLNRGIEEIEHLLGVKASAGGQHLGSGTRNALVALGPATYLEIIAPDPEQPPPANPRPFGLDTLRKSRLVTWAVKGTDLERLRNQAAESRVPLGDVTSGKRTRPDGVKLLWHYTAPSAMVADGIVPFFIDWGQLPHPAKTAAKGARLTTLRAEHPDALRVERMLQQFALDIPVKSDRAPALIAIIEGSRGRVELR